MADSGKISPTGNARNEATGYSRGEPSEWSFIEAFNDAIARLGSSDPGGTADWQDSYVVTRIGAHIGGIAHTSELYVTVAFE